MNSTIIRNKSSERIQITETTLSTIRAFGKGHITTALITNAINSQIGRNWTKVDEQQVGRAMNEISRRQWLKLQSLGHGSYLWQ